VLREEREKNTCKTAENHTADPRKRVRKSALVAFTDAHTYFEVGAVITTLILLGRFFEAS